MLAIGLAFVTLQTGDKALEQRQEMRTKLMKLNAMSGAQFLKGCGPIATELYEDVAPVLGSIRSFDQFLSGEPVNQLDGGMMSNLKLFGEFADSQALSSGKPFDRE
jgi:hypothetical protein